MARKFIVNQLHNIVFVKGIREIKLIEPEEFYHCDSYRCDEIEFVLIATDKHNNVIWLGDFYEKLSGYQVLDKITKWFANNCEPEHITITGYDAITERND